VGVGRWDEGKFSAKLEKVEGVAGSIRFVFVFLL